MWHSVASCKALHSIACPEHRNTNLLFPMEMFIFSLQHLNFMQKLYQAQALQILSLNAIHQFSPSVLLSWCHLQGEKHSQACSFLWCKPPLSAGSPASGIIWELEQEKSVLLGHPSLPLVCHWGPDISRIKSLSFVKEDSGKLRRNAECLLESNLI